MKGATTYAVAFPEGEKCYPVGHAATRFGLTHIGARRTIRCAASIRHVTRGGFMCAAAHSNKLQALNAAGTAPAPVGAAVVGRAAGVEEAPRSTRRGGKRSAFRLREEERRLYPRLPLHLTVRVKRVGGHPEAQIVDLLSTDISCSGIRFLWENKLAPGAVVDMEVLLADRPGNKPGMKMFTAAHVVRVEPDEAPGWYAVAAAFDDIVFDPDPSVKRSAT